MKKLLLISTLLFSFNSFAEIACPLPKDLSSDDATFAVVDESQDGSVVLYATTLFEADNKIWRLVMGPFDENRPRLQAKRLLKKAIPATIEYDEDGASCIYHKDMDKKFPEIILATLQSEIKPCPSLQRMKDTPFTSVEEICQSSEPGCGNYAAWTTLEDRGTNWNLISMSYTNKETAILEAEKLKEKAHKPFIIGERYCLYAQDNSHYLVAFENSIDDNRQALIKKFMQTKMPHRLMN